MWADFRRLVHLRDLRAGIRPPMADLRASDLLIQRLSVASALLGLVALVLLLVWVHAANQRLRDLGPGPFRYTPGFAVGACLIPVANVVLIYLTMRELWRSSGRSSDGDWRVTLWWVAWLARGACFAALLLVPTRRGSGLDVLLASFIRNTRVALVSYGSSVVAAVAVVLLLAAVYERQTHSAEALAEARAAGPGAWAPPAAAHSRAVTMWYAYRDGVQSRPLQREALRAMLRAGELRPGDFVWREGWPEWRPASAAPELAPAFAPPPAPPPAPEAPPAPTSAPLEPEPAPD
jgi:hypothetical protein